MIGIIGAMSVEVDGLKAMLEGRRNRNVCGITFSTGSINGTDVVVAQSGVGKVFASMCASAMIARFRPSLIINTGVAGCIDPELAIGEILVSSGAVQHDFDTSPIDGTPRGWNESLKTVIVEADAAAAKILLNAASVEGIRAKSGVIATGDCFIADKEKKAELSSAFGASACEMEGGAIAAVSAYNKIPFVILRAISDGADNGAVLDFPSFCRLAADNSIKVLTNALPRLGELYC
ncbi:MAG: 5'-methylthioadenosine/adenosylhomocysteine nucleosidase [Clostridia bacterium]|nr:5'-methylthioadenosine/adenosylhomocysteine nucleosidase [Clostridia bacterium]MBP5781817.1 5'-methylthioadenosine/adenosylhomocysteine nucleosidase [Clostridia bacterium]